MDTEEQNTRVIGWLLAMRDGEKSLFNVRKRVATICGLQPDFLKIFEKIPLSGLRRCNYVCAKFRSDPSGRFFQICKTLQRSVQVNSLKRHSRRSAVRYSGFFLSLSKIVIRSVIDTQWLVLRRPSSCGDTRCGRGAYTITIQNESVTLKF